MNHEQIEALVAVLKESPRLAEVEIRLGAGGNKPVSLRLRRPVSPPAAARTGKSTRNGNGAGSAEGSGVVSAPLPSAADTPASAAPVVIEAGLVGIFRPRRKGPGPISPGEFVEAGQVLGHIEAMRLLNDCVAPASGRVSAVLVQDGQPVQYGQPLFELDTRADAEEGTES